MQLGGIGKAGGNEHLAPLRMPTAKAGGTEFHIATCVALEFRRLGRNAFDDEVVRRLGIGGRSRNHRGQNE